MLSLTPIRCREGSVGAPIVPHLVGTLALLTFVGPRLRQPVYWNAIIGDLLKVTNLLISTANQPPTAICTRSHLHRRIPPQSTPVHPSPPQSTPRASSEFRNKTPCPLETGLSVFQLAAQQKVLHRERTSTMCERTSTVCLLHPPCRCQQCIRVITDDVMRT